MPAKLGKFRPRTAAGILRWLKLRMLHPRRRFALFYMGPGTRLEFFDAGTLSVGRAVHATGDLTLHMGGPLVLGDEVYLARGCFVSCHRHVEIGSKSAFGEYVSIHDNDHGLDAADVPVADRPRTYGPVKIGAGVWIGAKTTITQGVTIGENAVIGANSLVTEDVPAGAVAVGVPARVIGDAPG